MTELVLENQTISEEDLIEKNLVYSSDELWYCLCPLMESIENVVLLEYIQQEKLPSDALQEKWATLKDQFRDRLEDSMERVILAADDSIYQKLQEKDFEELTTHLKNNALYRESKCGVLKTEACDLLGTLDLHKYEHSKVNDEKGEQSLRVFLADLFGYCIEHEEGCFYEYMLPFDGQAQEAKKLHGFLQEQEILKSGVLSKHEYDSDDDKLKSSVKKALGKSYTKKQITFILKVVQGLRGEIRSFERKMVVGFVNFYDLKDRPEDIPETLDFFTSWHLDHFLTLEQVDKGWWDWNAFAVAMLGLAQVIAGVLLVTFTAGIGAQIGSALISEGINDMVYATIAGLTGTFSWKDWAIQKAISVAISIVTGGLGALAAPLKVAAKVGSAARYSTFAKTMAKAAGEFALQATAGIITDVVLADVQERVINAIVKEIKERLFTQISGKLRSRLTRMAEESSSDDEFQARSEAIISNFEKSLGLNPLIPEEFDQLRSQVVASLKQKYKEIADNLSKSNSKWAKVAGAGIKAALIANQVFTVVNAGLKIGQAVEALVSLVGVAEHSSEEHLRSDIDDELVQRELDGIEKCFQDYIEKQLQEKLKTALGKVIKGSLKSIAKAGKKTVSSAVKKTFHGKSTSQVVKDLYSKKTKRTFVSDHEEQPHQKQTDHKEVKQPKPTTQTEKKLHALEQRRETFKDSIIKPKKQRPSKETVSDVQRTLKATEGKLPTRSHSDNLASGYSHDRGLDLEEISRRRRTTATNSSAEHTWAKQQPHINNAQYQQPKTGLPRQAVAADVKRALHDAKGKLPETHGHKPDNLATGYSQDRGLELERMSPRSRAASQGHLTDSNTEQIRARRRAFTNCPQKKESEIRQPHPERADSHPNLPSAQEKQSEDWRPHQTSHEHLPAAPGLQNSDSPPKKKRNKKERISFKARLDASTYSQKVDGKTVVTNYSQKDGLSIESTETYHDNITGTSNAKGELTVDKDVRLTSLKMTVKGAQFGNGRAPVTKPLAGMIDRSIAADPGETAKDRMIRKMVDTEVTGHGAPGSAGVNAGEGLATSVIKSPSYNYQEKTIWEGKVSEQIGKQKFQVDVDIKLGPVTIDDPKEWIEKVNAARESRYKEKHGKDSNIPESELVHASNAEALQERMQLFHDKDPRMHRVESFKAVYKSEDGQTVYNPNCKGLGPDLELGIPKRFNQPDQPAELKHTATVNGKEVEIGEISGGKRKVQGPQVFNKVPVQRAPRSSPAPQVNDGSNINVQRPERKAAPISRASQKPSASVSPPLADRPPQPTVPSQNGGERNVEKLAPNDSVLPPLASRPHLHVPQNRQETNAKMSASNSRRVPLLPSLPPAQKTLSSGGGIDSPREEGD